MTLSFIPGNPVESLPGAGDTVAVYTWTAAYTVHIRSVINVTPPLDGIVTMTVLAERQRYDDELSAK